MGLDGGAETAFKAARRVLKTTQAVHIIHPCKPCELDVHVTLGWLNAACDRDLRL
jgi:hypothetical protein